MSEATGLELHPLESALRGLKQRFADAVIDADRNSMREHLVVVPGARLREVAAAVHREWGGTLVTAFALDERERHGRFRLHYLFSMAPDDAVLTLIAALPGDDPRFPSVTPEVHAAHWLEREMQDLMGVTADGHPDPRPLVAHDGWPRGCHPLRRDFAPPAGISWPPRFGFTPVEGDGVFEIPVGPIHAGIIEPGHFRFSSVGEAILKLDVRLAWKYRGLETLARGQPAARVLEIAERACGLCAFSHALAFSSAVEEAAGVMAPPRARALRSLAAELERLYNHCGDLAGVLLDVAYAVGAAEGQRLKEVVQQAADALFGHRFLRGLCVPGGVTRDLDDAQQQWLRDVLGTVRADVEALVRAATSNAAVMDRLVGAGALGPDAARDLGVVGPAARASGFDRDVRRTHPYAFYRDLDFQVPVRAEGDVSARFAVKADEIHESINLVDQMLLHLPGGLLIAERVVPPAGRAGLGMVESPRGLLSHWVRAGEGGAIDEWRMRSASHANWPAVAIAVLDNIVPDFPLVNKSFNLCYACVDR
ncbi:MAG TPA: NADH-quinone oxidoreductase subunit C [Candidatus Eisenbacteria bacterium]|jgi:Ni,Fe-hydrogenase III large subunit/Ni,Fe-hydrogenase III component G